MNELANQYFFEPGMAYLNHGGYGAVPRTTHEFAAEWARKIELNPVQFMLEKLPDLIQEVSNKTGGFLGTSADKLQFVLNVTHGMNILVHGLPLGDGDEVLTTSLGYGAVAKTWSYWSGIKGFSHRRISIPIPIPGEDKLTELIFKEVTENTRVICVDHICSGSSYIFPLEKIAAEAKVRGIISIVDGAHAPGQLPLNLNETGVDYYLGNFHKWLSAPKACAFLYSKTGAFNDLDPLIVSWGWNPSSEGDMESHHNWIGTRDFAPLLAIPEAMRFFEEHVGPVGHKRCEELGEYALSKLLELDCFINIYSDEQRAFSQMVSVRITKGIDNLLVMKRLRDEFKVELMIDGNVTPNFLRICCAPYNDESDINRAVEALKACLCS